MVQSDKADWIDKNKMFTVPRDKVKKNELEYANYDLEGFAIL